MQRKRITGDIIDRVPRGYSKMTKDEPIIRLSLLYDTRPQPNKTELHIAIGSLSNIVWAVEQARSFRASALSHRGFPVTATAIMANVDNNSFAFPTGFNVKPKAGKSRLDIHAEQMAIAKGRRAGLNRVIALCVQANPSDLDANPNQLPTLQPCSSRCVPMLEQAPEVDDNTLVFSMNQNVSVIQLYTVGFLTGRHSGELVEQPFSLETESDNVTYAQEIVPGIIPKIEKLYQTN